MQKILPITYTTIHTSKLLNKTGMSMMKTIHRKYDAAGKYSLGTILLLSSCELRNIVSNSNSPVVMTRVLRKALAGEENGVSSSYNRAVK